jgi:hypothetical protein
MLDRHEDINEGTKVYGPVYPQVVYVHFDRPINTANSHLILARGNHGDLTMTGPKTS